MKKLQCLDPVSSAAFMLTRLQGQRSKDKIVSIYARKEETAKNLLMIMVASLDILPYGRSHRHPEVDVVCISLPNQSPRRSSDALLQT